VDIFPSFEPTRNATLCDKLSLRTFSCRLALSPLNLVCLLFELGGVTTLKTGAPVFVKKH
jgi:hypothetical protein